jgi:hypothetical protein
VPPGVDFVLDDGRLGDVQRREERVDRTVYVI